MRKEFHQQGQNQTWDCTKAIVFHYLTYVQAIFLSGWIWMGATCPSVEWTRARLSVLCGGMWPTLTVCWGYRSKCSLHSLSKVAFSCFYQMAFYLHLESLKINPKTLGEKWSSVLKSLLQFEVSILWPLKVQKSSEASSDSESITVFFFLDGIWTFNWTLKVFRCTGLRWKSNDFWFNLHEQAAKTALLIYYSAWSIWCCFHASYKWVVSMCSACQHNKRMNKTNTGISVSL